jgi:hypothetical protein
MRMQVIAPVICPLLMCFLLTSVIHALKGRLLQYRSSSGRVLPIVVASQVRGRALRPGASPILAWQGKTVSEICQQLKDPQRNGGRSLELLHEHLAEDDLVGNF